MLNLNKVILAGRLGEKPEVRYTPSGHAVCNLRVATNESWKDAQGERQQRAEWHRVVCWGKTAENCAQFLDKGSAVYVEGKQATRKYDVSGVTKYVTETVANMVHFMDRPKAKAEPDLSPEAQAILDSVNDDPEVF